MKNCSINYSTEYCTLDILYSFAYCMHNIYTYYIFNYTNLFTNCYLILYRL